MKALSVMRKTLRELLRERMTTALMLIFPPLLVAFYYIAFGQTSDGLSNYISVLILNQDAGAAAFEADSQTAGQMFVELLQAAEYEGQPLFDITQVDDHQTAEITLREHKAALMIVIPENFSAVLQDFFLESDSAAAADITLVGAPESSEYVFARSLLNGYLRYFALEIVGWDESIDIQYQFVPGTGTMSDFDYGVGGVIVFGIAFSSLIAAEVMVREYVSGSLRRLRLSGLSAFELLAGVTLALTIVAVIQVPITLGAARLMGFINHGSVLLIVAVCLIYNLAAIGLGLLVACFSRTPADATNLASAVLVPLVFLSDALYPMPAVPLFHAGERVIQLYDFLPTTHAVAAIRQMTVYGKGMGDLIFEVSALIVLSVCTFLLGVVVYQRRRMKLS
jgi:ABC-2 type transport system permease protein